MRLVVTSVYVDDQDKALAFYTDVLGFVKKHDVPVGDGYRWLTVVSPEDPAGPELLLEPAGHPAVAPFQQALFADGIPLTSFGVDDVEAEHARLSGLGVVFRMPPTAMGPVTISVLDDTCGNLIQIAQRDEDAMPAPEV
ncbi:MAG TPA: VOC family protein [Thermoanaerobaculia bacterium]|nr:VOC family protein [Thermoanaerobaculia bacterium]